MRHPRLTKLEEDLAKIQGVTGVRVVGDEAPSEIHIVAGSERSPKQIVRDVQSLATTNFDLPIDHRIVSVVRLEEAGVEPAAPPAAPEAVLNTNGHRPVLDAVVLASKRDKGWVKVVVTSSAGETSEAAAAAGATRETRAKGAAAALLKALETTLEAKQMRVEIEHLTIQLDSTDAVIVRAVIYERGIPTPVVGSALIHDDVATASARALLHALNRKLS